MARPINHRVVFRDDEDMEGTSMATRVGGPWNPIGHDGNNKLGDPWDPIGHHGNDQVPSLFDGKELGNEGLPEDSQMAASDSDEPTASSNQGEHRYCGPAKKPIAVQDAQGQVQALI
ncbi:unnamed protein product [Vitrella brassicaformis CCMP3155]|uniref:Uncharacterized protein n=1 Tax=Vitrella brassicaformis (strain CCMP3155) TaxID=1169540 RepID=A0A0G4GV86_VITBC|nr:unnamed protein product [Vitrella brassicaformis CCMP3155]|eukprot:CEM34762.1 unnamed protein product [Vitrella brassicaformis CCMP3155]